MIGHMKYIIKSGTGYLLNFDNGQPFCTSNRAEATRYSEKQAIHYGVRMGLSGIEAEIVMDMRQ